MKLREWITQSQKQAKNAEPVDTGPQHVDVTVARGYHPGRVQLSAGRPATLRFTRREGAACSRELVFPTLGLRTELPQGQAVDIQLPELTPGSYPFTCGMNMLKGTVEVS